MPYLSRPSGALSSTENTVRTGHGVLTYATAGDEAITLYDGTSTSGTLIDKLAANVHVAYHTPVQFGTGLFVSVASTTGIAIVHTG